MPVYSYQCKECGDATDIVCSIGEYTTRRGSPPLCSCDVAMQRRYDAPNIKPGFQEHYNPSLGKRVSKRRELTSDLSRLSDETSERMGGMPVKFAPIDPNDAKCMTERKGVESRRKKARVRQADARAKNRQEVLSTIRKGTGG